MGQVRPRAAVLATVGALGVAASAYFSWSGGGADTARAFPLRKLLFVSNVTGEAPSYWQSMSAPLVVIGALGVLGALLLSRVVLLISTLLGVATVGLWVATFLLDKKAGGLSFGDIGVGSWVAVGGILILLVGLIALRERGEEEDEAEDAVRPYSPLPRTYGSSERTTKIGPDTATGTPGSDSSGFGSPGTGSTGYGSPGLGTAGTGSTGGAGSASPSSLGPVGGSSAGRYLPSSGSLDLGPSPYGDSGSGSGSGSSGSSGSGGSGGSGGSWSSF